MTASVVIPILTIFIGPLLAYLVASRRLSGDIQTSEATDLWRESASIREDYRDQIRILTARVRELEGQLAKCMAETNRLREAQR